MIRFFQTTAWAFFFATVAVSQSIPVSLRLVQADQVVDIPSGGAATINTPVGTTETAELQLVYRGASTLSITAPPQLVGSSAFTIDQAGSYPLVLKNGNVASFRVQFKPRSGASVSTQVSIPFTEVQAAGTATGLAVVTLLGTAPAFVVGYISPVDGNFVTLGSGGFIELPTVLPNLVTSVTVVIQNRGSGSGEVDSIVIEGAGFRATGLPSLPVVIDAGNYVGFGLRLDASPAGTYMGSLNIGLGDGSTVHFDLLATVARAQLVYEVAIGDRIDTVPPGQVSDVGQVLPGETRPIQVNIRNTGQLEVPLNISFTGNGFVLSEAPTVKTLVPGQSALLLITFAPTAAASYRARLRVNDDVLEFTGSGGGSRLQYSYTISNSVPNVVLPGDRIFFPATSVGGMSVMNFEVDNLGSSPANIIQLSLDSNRGGFFTLKDVNPLPTKLDPQGRITFSVVYTPIETGAVTASLRIDGATFPIQVVVPSAPSLPTLSFTVPSGTVLPLTQPGIGVRIATPYSTDIVGTLNLTTEASAFVTDPSVRFANGQLTVDFTIPTGTTQALFPNGTQQIRLQTGSTAGDILIGAFITSPTSSGDVTSPLQILRLTVPTLAPILLGGTFSRSGNQLSLQLNGISTPRSLTQLDIEFKAASGFTLVSPKLSINIQAEGLLWFSSSASQTAGGVFQIALPLAVSGSTSTTSPIESIIVTVSNVIGQSNAITIVVPN